MASNNSKTTATTQQQADSTSDAIGANEEQEMASVPPAQLEQEEQPLDLSLTTIDRTIDELQSRITGWFATLPMHGLMVNDEQQEVRPESGANQQQPANFPGQMSLDALFKRKDALILEFSELIEDYNNQINSRKALLQSAEFSEFHSQFQHQITKYEDLIARMETELASLQNEAAIKSDDHQSNSSTLAVLNKQQQVNSFKTNCRGKMNKRYFSSKKYLNQGPSCVPCTTSEINKVALWYHPLIMWQVSEAAKFAHHAYIILRLGEHAKFFIVPSNLSSNDIFRILIDQLTNGRTITVYNSNHLIIPMVFTKKIWDFLDSTKRLTQLTIENLHDSIPQVVHQLFEDIESGNFNIIHPYDVMFIETLRNFRFSSHFLLGKASETNNFLAADNFSTSAIEKFIEQIAIDVQPDSDEVDADSFTVWDVDNIKAFLRLLQILFGAEQINLTVEEGQAEKELNIIEGESTEETSFSAVKAAEKPKQTCRQRRAAMLERRKQMICEQNAHKITPKRF